MPLEKAKQIAIDSVKHDVKSKGGKLAKNSEIKLDVDRVDIPGMEGDVGLISAKVLAECESSTFLALS